MRVVLAEARKDLLLTWANKAEIVSLLLVPLIVVIFLGYAEEGLIVSHAGYKLAVVDLDGSPQSQQLIAGIRNDAHIDTSVQRPAAFSEADAAHTLRDGSHAALLVIPAGSGTKMARRDSVTLPVYTDPSQANRAALLMLSLRREAARIAAPQAAIDIVDRAAVLPPGMIADTAGAAVSAELAHPTLTVDARPASGGRSLPSGFDEAVPGIALMWTIAFFSRGALVADDERRTFHTAGRTATTRASRTARLLGHVLSGYLIVGLQVAVLFAVGALVFGIDVGSVGALALVLAAFVAVPAAGSALLGALGLDGQMLELLAFVGMFVIGAFSGAFVPLYLLPAWLGKAAVVSPLYWAISAVQDVMIRGAAFGDVVQQATALLALAAAFFVVAAVRSLRPRHA